MKTTGKPEDWVEPGELNLAGRFDIFVKYQYARAFLAGSLSRYHRRAYEDHIRAFNNFMELDADGTPRKVNAEQFVRSFDKLIVDVAGRGFDVAHAVPVSAEQVPINGAHRVAACMAAGSKVYVSFPGESFPPKWGYEFFRARHMAAEHMDLGAQGLVDHVADLHLAIIFGAAIADRDKIVEELKSVGAIYYEKNLSLSRAGQDNLIRVVYDGERWLGRREFGYLGARGKARPCFPDDCPSTASVVFFRRTVPPEDLVAAKARIRDAAGLGNHSIHITDSREEVERICAWVLNSNGFHLLNNKRYGKFASFERDFVELKGLLDQHEIDPQHVCVVGSAILAIYGVRDARDLDVIAAEDQRGKLESAGLTVNNAHWEAYGFDIRDLIYNPANHFVFEGVKCLGLEPLIKLKTSRGESKDEVDLSLIKLMIDRDRTIRVKVARVARLIRLYSNLRWLKSFVGHWLIRLGLRARRLGRKPRPRN